MLTAQSKVYTVVNCMLKLVKLEEKYKEQLFEMMDEWSNSGEKIIPYAIRKAKYENYKI